MDLYKFVLFVHVLAGIVVVGGSFAMDFMGTRAKRARTVDSLMSWLQALAVASKVVAVTAAVVLAAGLYLAFAGRWWGDAWVVVALVLFLAAGALAGAVMDKGTAKMIAVAETFPDGPMSPDLGRQLAQPAMALTGPLMVGIDVGIVFLMTNKPAAWAPALLVAVITVGAGLLVGLRERRHLLHPAAPTPPAAAPAT